MDAMPPNQPHIVPPIRSRTEPGRPITLALQGGGAHGAFEWGVIDRLLAQAELHIDTVSGVSAGAMNAAMLVQGLATGGPQEARRLLKEFWRRVAASAGSTDPEDAPWPWSLPGAFEMLRQGSRLLPALDVIFGGNPLRPLLNDLLDPTAFGRPGAPRLVVAATRVRTGEARLFCDAEVGVDALLASACLPQLFPAVEIDGEAYWDGGYSNNPPLRPLIESGAPPDVILVKTSPLERPDPPRTANEIMQRTTELSFDAALREELRSLAVAQRLPAELPALPASLARLRDARLHMIVAEQAFRALKRRSRMDANWSFLLHLRRIGETTAAAWMRDHLSDVGHRSSFDLTRFARTGLPDRARETA